MKKDNQIFKNTRDIKETMADKLPTILIRLNGLENDVSNLKQQMGSMAYLTKAILDKVEKLSATR